MKKDNRDAYKKAGVDSKGIQQLIRQVFSGPSSPLPPYFFCHLLPISSSTYLALSTDGVGTKLLLGLETSMVRHLGRDLVAMVYNDLLTSGAEPLAFLNYYSTTQLDRDVFLQVLSSIQRACHQCQMTLVGGETAQMPGLYRENHFDLAGFGVGMVEKNRILSPDRAGPGQILIGFPSTGFHSNGYSLIRKVLHKKELSQPHTFDGQTHTLAQFLMEPTEIYTQIQQHLPDLPILALAHITGGGHTKNLPRIFPPSCRAILLREAFVHHQIFDWFRERANLSWAEMMGIFNCGYGMVALVEEREVSVVLDQIPPARVVGQLEKSQPGKPAVELW